MCLSYPLELRGMYQVTKLEALNECMPLDWSAAATGRPDSGFAPCCHPVSRFGYCMGWVWMGLSKGQNWKMPSRECSLVLPGPVLQVPTEERDLPPDHSRKQLVLGLV